MEKREFEKILNKIVEVSDKNFLYSILNYILEIVKRINNSEDLKEFDSSWKVFRERLFNEFKKGKLDESTKEETSRSILVWEINNLSSDYDFQKHPKGEGLKDEDMINLLLVLIKQEEIETLCLSAISLGYVDPESQFQM